MGVGPCIELNMCWTWTRNPDVGGMLGDGSFMIFLQNGRFGVVIRIRLKIRNQNRCGGIIKHTHNILLLIMDHILYRLFLQILCGRIYANRHNWQVLVPWHHHDRDMNPQKPNTAPIKKTQQKINYTGVCFRGP